MRSVTLNGIYRNGNAKGIYTERTGRERERGARRETETAGVRAPYPSRAGAGAAEPRSRGNMEA